MDPWRSATVLLYWHEICCTDLCSWTLMKEKGRLEMFCYTIQGRCLVKQVPLGRSKLQTVTWLYDWICADIVLSKEAIMKLCKAVKPKLALSDKTESLVAFPNLRIKNCIHLPEIAKVRIYVRSGRGKEGPMRTNQNRVWPNWQRFHKKKDGKLQKNPSFSNSNSKSEIRHSFKCFQN